MDLSRFKECSAAFGADKRRWPPHDQVLYDRFAQTPDGMAILAEASRTDHFLDALTSALPDLRRARHVAALAMPAWRRLGIAGGSSGGECVARLHRWAICRRIPPPTRARSPNSCSVRKVLRR